MMPKRTETQTGHLKQLQWVVDFVQRDLQALGKKKKEWLKLVGGLAEFVRSAGYGDVPPVGWNDNALAQLAVKTQPKLRAHIERLDDLREVEEIRIGTVKARKRKHSALTFVLSGNDTTVEAWAVEGERYTVRVRPRGAESQVYAALTTHLVSSGIAAGQIRPCSTCGRVVVHEKLPRRDTKPRHDGKPKEHHCSRACRVKAAKARYRKSGKESEARHTRYAKTVKGKVQRRPRKQRPA